jgi:tetratricopeptide (TPR) repeat protein
LFVVRWRKGSSSPRRLAAVPNQQRTTNNQQRIRNHGARRSRSHTATIRRAGGPPLLSPTRHLGAVGRAFFSCRRRERSRGESLAIARTLGDLRLVAWSLHTLGTAAEFEGDYDAAEALYNVALDRGDDEAALSVLAEALRRWQKFRDAPWGLAECLEALSEAVARQGDHERATRLLGAAETARGENAPPRTPFDGIRYRRRVATLRTALGEERLADLRAVGRSMTREEAIADAALPSVGSRQ